MCNFPKSIIEWITFFINWYFWWQIWPQYVTLWFNFPLSIWPLHLKLYCSDYLVWVDDLLHLLQSGEFMWHCCPHWDMTLMKLVTLTLAAGHSANKFQARIPGLLPESETEASLLVLFYKCDILIFSQTQDSCTMCGEQFVLWSWCLILSLWVEHEMSVIVEDHRLQTNKLHSSCSHFSQFPVRHDG